VTGIKHHRILHNKYIHKRRSYIHAFYQPDVVPTPELLLTAFLSFSHTNEKKMDKAEATAITCGRFPVNPSFLPQQQQHRARADESPNVLHNRTLVGCETEHMEYFE